MGASWQAFYAHLCAASIIRAMPETEIPPAMRGDLYYPPIKSKSKDKMRKCDFSHKKVLENYWIPAYNWSVLYE